MCSEVRSICGVFFAAESLASEGCELGRLDEGGIRDIHRLGRSYGNGLKVKTK